VHGNSSEIFFHIEFSLHGAPPFCQSLLTCHSHWEVENATQVKLNAVIDIAPPANDRSTIYITCMVLGTKLNLWICTVLVLLAPPGQGIDQLVPECADYIWQYSLYMLLCCKSCIRPAYSQYRSHHEWSPVQKIKAQTSTSIEYWMWFPPLTQAKEQESIYLLILSAL